MRMRKAFGFGQCFLGDDGHIDLVAFAPPVEDQILNLIRRLPLKRDRNLFAALGGIRAGRMDRDVQDLIIWDDQFCGHPAG